MKPMPRSLVEVLVGRDVAAAALQAHFHVQLAAFAHGRDVDFLVQDLHVAVGFDHARGDDTGLVRAQVNRLRAFAVQLEGNLLQVEDDVRRVFHYAGDRLELVQHTLDLDCGNGRALDGGEQHATQRIADSGAEAPLKGLGAELSVLLGERLGIDCKTLGLLKSSPKHVVSPAQQAPRSILQRLCLCLLFR